jgi:hypothetical protein
VRRRSVPRTRRSGGVAGSNEKGAGVTAAEQPYHHNARCVGHPKLDDGTGLTFTSGHVASNDLGRRHASSAMYRSASACEWNDLDRSVRRPSSSRTVTPKISPAPMIVEPFESSTAYSPTI